MSATTLQALAGVCYDDLQVWILIEDLLNAASIPAWLALGRRIILSGVCSFEATADSALAKRRRLIVAARWCCGRFVGVDCEVSLVSILAVELNRDAPIPSRPFATNLLSRVVGEVGFTEDDVCESRRSKLVP